MPQINLRNLNIEFHRPLLAPKQVRAELPLSDDAAATVASTRRTIVDILSGTDPRLFILMGPCSIHDVNSAKEYAAKLRILADDMRDRFVLIMRAYFEKPRTSVGWKGFFNDPFLNGSFQIEEGLRLARRLLLEINEIGVPVGTEALDPFLRQYMDELISWSVIGARTVESQTHRELASGLSTPVGFKNGTDGNIQTAINAIKTASQGHAFLGLSGEGQCSIYQTRGNPHTHLVLRGGAEPNYDPQHIAACEEMLRQAGLPPSIMVDCSHGNSGRDPQRQAQVFKECIDQIKAGNRSIKGLMLESHLLAGSQPFQPDLSALKYGVSITDPCLDWDMTETIIREAHHDLGPP